MGPLCLVLGRGTLVDVEAVLARLVLVVLVLAQKSAQGRAPLDHGLLVAPEPAGVRRR